MNSSPASAPRGFLISLALLWPQQVILKRCVCNWQQELWGQKEITRVWIWSLIQHSGKNVHQLELFCVCGNIFFNLAPRMCMSQRVQTAEQEFGQSWDALTTANHFYSFLFAILPVSFQFAVCMWDAEQSLSSVTLPRWTPAMWGSSWLKYLSASIIAAPAFWKIIHKYTSMTSFCQEARPLILPTLKPHLLWTVVGNLSVQIT